MSLGVNEYRFAELGANIDNNEGMRVHQRLVNNEWIETSRGYTNNMSIQRNTSFVNGNAMSNIISEEAGSFNGLSNILNQALTDQFLYGSSMIQTFINSNGDPEIRRIDPNDYIMGSGLTQGSGLEAQLENSNRTGYSSTLTEHDIRQVMDSLYTTTNTNSATWVAYTGQQGYNNFQNQMSSYISGTDSYWTRNNIIDKDNSGSIIKINKSEDYKVFSLSINKNSCKVSVSTTNGSKREYDLFMKNAKRGIYLNTQNIKWKYESK